MNEKRPEAVGCRLRDCGMKSESGITKNYELLTEN
jgi:hypothetical protein